MAYWQAVPAAGRGSPQWLVISETGAILAQVGGKTALEAELNARLMADAPRLREALRERR